MKKFYFTYGTKGHPFYGGWSEVYAPDIDAAIRLHKTYHSKENGFLNCAEVYNEEEFKETEMYQNGNYGRYSHEVLDCENEKKSWFSELFKRKKK